MADETSGPDSREDDWSTSETSATGSDGSKRTADEPTDGEHGEADEWGTTAGAGGDRAGDGERSGAGTGSTTERIPIDLSASGTDGEKRDGERHAGDDTDDPYAPEPSSAPIESGDPSLEHIIFVALGAAATILVLARVVLVTF
ncbi:DUF7312 domain-containing protein [Natrialba asiatica]|uniref:Cell-surface adhesin n=1 Tax=Natrialba asiatica (strain ATCC 700177 / DSM 12278 / JCM 9576 / FERM P-10747 / NBRC 102637 / 172P1) TaxID=29540 RepID=M0ALG9_NATA1|nr:hypothetical protein [Natrialba asiatica]ELY99186.1 cell-surface adhesin [Natrialba asiatica DSM 12278]